MTDDGLGDRVYIECIPDLPPVDYEPSEDYVEIPLSLLYRLADDSPLGGLWNMKSVPEKLADLGFFKKENDDDQH